MIRSWQAREVGDGSPAGGRFTALGDAERYVDERRALEMIRHGRADYAAFYGGHAGSTLAAQLGAAGDASGISFRRSPRPGTTRGAPGSTIAEFFGRRLGCLSHSPLYAGVELKRLCPVAG